MDSSISNSSYHTIPSAHRLMGVLVLALVISALFLTWVYHSYYQGFICIYNDLGVVLDVEKQVIQKYPEPEVMIIGTSRLAFTVMARRMESKLGLEPGRFVTITYPRLFDERLFKLYERNRDYFRKPRLVVFLADEYMMLTKHGPRRLRFARTPGRYLEERLQALSGDGLSDINEKGKSLLYHLRFKLGMERLEGSRTYFHRRGAWFRRFMYNRTISQQEAREKFPSNAESYYKHSAFETEKPTAYYRFFDSFVDNGQQLILLDMPRHPLFAREVATRFSKLHRKNQDAFKLYATTRQVPFVSLDATADCQFTPNMFGDHVHTNHIGSPHLMRCLARLIRARQKSDSLPGN